MRALAVRGDDWRKQLAQVIDDLQLAASPSFTRCVECNTLLEPRSREEARSHVPPYVHRTQRTFLRCPSCGRYYWKGTHWQRMREGLAGLVSSREEGV